MNKKVRVMSDARVFSEAIIILVLFWGVTLYFWINGGQYIPRSCMIGFTIGVSLETFIFLVSIFPKVGAVMTLTSDGITVSRLFRKKKQYTYKDFSHIQHGCFTIQGSVRHYIVLSRYSMRTNDLMQINNIPNSDDVFRIKFSKRNYNKLYQILPRSQRVTMEAIFTRLELV